MVSRRKTVRSTGHRSVYPRRWSFFVSPLLVLSLIVLLTACAPEATSVSEAPTTAPSATPVPPTETPVPPTETPVPPTETPVPPTEAPAEVEAAATPTAVAEPTATPVPPTSTPEPAPAPLPQTFRIIPEQSQAQYEVDEEFFNRDIQFFTAVGVTNEITGSFDLTIDGNQAQLGETYVQVDLRTLETDSPRRDNAIRTRWLESNTYPLAVFTGAEVQEFPADAAAGQDVNFTLNGDMTIREITQPLTFDVTARLDNNTLTGEAVTRLFMVDFGFDPPSILGALEVTDGVTVTVNFVAEANE